MSTPAPSSTQQARLKRFDIDRCVDIHCHCLPGVDDGPATLADALAVCRALVDDGITHVMASSHQLGRYDGVNTGEKLRRAVGDLQIEVDRASIPLRLCVAADVRVDDTMADRIGTGDVLTLNDARKYVLVELPHERELPADAVLEPLHAVGVRGVLTHPERNTELSAKPARLDAWYEAGAVIQLTAGSIVGDFGPATQSVCFDWIARGLVHVVASDAHDTRRRPPRMSAAIELLAARVGPHLTRRFCLENPKLIHEGQTVVDTRPRPTGLAATTQSAHSPAARFGRIA